MRRRAFYSKFLKSGLKDFFSIISKITILFGRLNSVLIVKNLKNFNSVYRLRNVNDSLVWLYFPYKIIKKCAKIKIF